MPPRGPAARGTCGAQQRCATSLLLVGREGRAGLRLARCCSAAVALVLGGANLG
jgi:hypothetical protein